MGEREVSDHWQVIEDALLEDYARIGKYADKWQYMNPIQERRLSELARIDAALAFVREQRAQAALLAPDAATLKEIRKFLEGQHYIASCVDDAVSPDMRRYAAALKWIDSHAKGDSDGK
jgi:hypothetical protein